MKHIFGFFLALFVVGEAYAVPATVKYIVAGDKIRVLTSIDGGEEEYTLIRFANVDTPELREKCDSAKRNAKLSRDRVSELLPVDTVVELKNVKKDKFANRVSANVILPDGRDIGEILIKESLGRSYNGSNGKRWCK